MEKDEARSPSLRGRRALVTRFAGGPGLCHCPPAGRCRPMRSCTGSNRSRWREPRRTRCARESGAPSGTRRADLNDVGRIEAMMVQAEKDLGGIDILLNNADGPALRPGRLNCARNVMERGRVFLGGRESVGRLPTDAFEPHWPGMRARGLGAGGGCVRHVMSSVYGAGATADRIACARTQVNGVDRHDARRHHRAGGRA